MRLVAGARRAEQSKLHDARKLDPHGAAAAGGTGRNRRALVGLVAGFEVAALDAALPAVTSNPRTARRGVETGLTGAVGASSSLPRVPAEVHS
jgi:hypothetical protein